MVNVLVALALAVPAGAQSSDSLGTWLQYEVPEEAGWSSDALEKAFDHAVTIRSAAVMVLKDGKVVLAWGDIERRLEAQSVRKTLINALYGIHVGDGTIDLGRTLGELGIKENVVLSDSERAARIVDLLHSMSGVYLPAAYAPVEQDEYRPPRDRYPPGKAFFYNNWDFNVLGSILNQETGVDLFVDFERRIAAPLGMEDYRPADGSYVLEPRRSLHPAYTFRISTRDLARFGQLYLKRGRWGEEQIIPEEWITESWTPGVRFSEGRGYGYLWFIAPAGEPEGLPYEELKRHDRYLGLGSGGQMLIVIPDLDLVFVHRGDTDNDRRFLKPERTRTIRDLDILKLADLIIEARSGEARTEPQLIPVHAVRLPNQQPPPPERIATAVAPSMIRDYVGQYRWGRDAEASIYLYGHDRMFIDVQGQGEAELFRESHDVFFVIGAPHVRLRFVRDGDNRIRELVAEERGDSVRARRVD